MGPHDRSTALLDIRGRDGRLDVAPAADELDVSAATIRRDIKLHEAAAAGNTVMLSQVAAFTGADVRLVRA